VVVIIEIICRKIEINNVYIMLCISNLVSFFELADYMLYVYIAILFLLNQSNTEHLLRDYFIENKVILGFF